MAHIENEELRDLTSWNFIDLVDLIKQCNDAAGRTHSSTQRRRSSS